ncbi:MAG: cytochrome b [Steroidobacteraceae bacterium]
MTVIRPTISSVRTQRLSEPVFRYDLTSVALHWLMAALILFDWLIGQGRGFAAPGTARAGLLSWHMLLGTAIGVILVARIAWRASAGRHFSYAPGPLGRAAAAAHIGLYVLMAATVLAGLATAMIRGTPIFGLVLPELAPQVILYPLAQFHSLFADLLGLLAAVHALAAIGHHFVLRDRVLVRMAPFLPPWFRVE